MLILSFHVCVFVCDLKDLSCNLMAIYQFNKYVNTEDKIQTICYCNDLSKLLYFHSQFEVPFLYHSGRNYRCLVTVASGAKITSKIVAKPEVSAEVLGYFHPTASTSPSLCLHHYRSPATPNTVTHTPLYLLGLR